MNNWFSLSALATIISIQFAYSALAVRPESHRNYPHKLRAQNDPCCGIDRQMPLSGSQFDPFPVRLNSSK